MGTWKEALLRLADVARGCLSAHTYLRGSRKSEISKARIFWRYFSHHAIRWRRATFISVKQPASLRKMCIVEPHRARVSQDASHRPAVVFVLKNIPASIYVEQPVRGQDPPEIQVHTGYLFRAGSRRRLPHGGYLRDTRPRRRWDQSSRVSSRCNWDTQSSGPGVNGDSGKPQAGYLQFLQLGQLASTFVDASERVANKFGRSVFTNRQLFAPPPRRSAIKELQGVDAGHIRGKAFHVHPKEGFGLKNHSPREQ
ncbi:hypothetical protein B0H19DRAFT_1228815 [Mycena capillaripes]|nr:hypothetical protein B0H19DRAFT_1228815 [Mycena capillaripes]